MKDPSESPRVTKYDSTNHEFAKTNQSFQGHCEEAGCPATGRQASKFRRDKGRAFAASKKRPVDTPMHMVIGAKS